MHNSYAKLLILAVLIAAASIPASAQTRYVRTSGSDAANDCTTSGSPCLTIVHALDQANSGDTIDIGPGTYPESLSLEKSITLQCAQNGTDVSGRTAGGGGETVIKPSGSADYVIQVRTSNVAINGCDIDGDFDGDVWAGIKIWNSGSSSSPDNISNIDILYNFIHEIDQPNPNGTFNYAYGIWAIGGGSNGNRGDVSDLVIDDNSIYMIGNGPDIGSALTGATEVAGAGMYVKSVTGASAGLGTTITDNTLDDLSDGDPSSATTLAGGTRELGLGIAVLQDNETSTNDSGASVSGNTYGDGDVDGPYVGVLVQTSSSTVAEALSGFGSQVVPLIINLAHPDISTLPLATIDTSDLSTATVPVFSVDGLTFSSSANVPNSIGYFRSISDAAANSTTDEIMPQPQNGTVTGATVTLGAGPSIVFTFANGDVFTILLTDYGAATPSIVGTPGDENVTIASDLLASTNLNVVLEGGSDAITMQAFTACTPFDTTHNPTSANDGTFVFTAACTAGAGTLTYSGLEPIDDSANFPANRTFNFSASAETIVLNAGTTANDNISFIDSELVEEVVFGNPTGSLTINAGGGDDTLNLGALDTSGGTIPAITVTVNGDAGADTFNVTPVNAYTSHTINGGAPATCPGDALSFTLPTGATADYSTSGTVSFTGVTLGSVTYTGIEAFGDFQADISVSAASTLYPGDVATYTLTVTNNGPNQAQCITIADAVANLTFQSGPTLSTGIIVGDDWVIASLDSGASATLTGTVFVNSATAVTATASTQTTDTDSSNNSDEVIGTPFKFPAKAHGQVGLVYEYTVGGVTFERIILGLFQGSPGGSSAVLCRIPEPDGVVFTVNPAFVDETWRECGTGLPYPLHVNDLFYDASADRIYLASWGSAGLYYSDDGGISWTASEPNLPDQATGWVNVYAITEDSAGILYISANNGLLFRSLNGGTSWQQISSLPHGSADTPWGLEADPTDAGTIYAGTRGKGVWVSADFGLSWAPVVAATGTGGIPVDALASVGAGDIYDLKFSPDDSDRLYAGTAEGLYSIDLSAGTPAWTSQGLTVTVDAGTVVPEVRGLAFTDDAGDADDDLYMALWGFGVYVDGDPNTDGSDQVEFSLRGSDVTFVAVGSNGSVYSGTAEGTFHTSPLSTHTNTEPDGSLEVPTDFALEQNYPNPFNPVTTIDFSLPEAATVQITVHDMLGRTVGTLSTGSMTAGRHSVQFDARDLPSGTYLYRMEAGGEVMTRLMVLLK
ncbi:MAG: T9SS type A sorting domain-containing protein [Rhodothermales bacterium]|nr:T9SS type A sorting domain-containing protein [Rhodothermales bacterium]MBO6780301.1 T9SS type A sorting domain-containing protein [Rhodothermales bacterium]